MKVSLIPVINWRDMRSLRNTCWKCNRLMLHAEEYSNIYTDRTRRLHYCRPNNKFKLKAHEIYGKSPVESILEQFAKCMYEIGSVTYEIRI